MFGRKKVAAGPAFTGPMPRDVEALEAVLSALDSGVTTELEAQLEEAKNKALYAAAEVQNVRRRLEGAEAREERLGREAGPEQEGRVDVRGAARRPGGGAPQAASRRNGPQGGHEGHGACHLGGRASPWAGEVRA